MRFNPRTFLLELPARALLVALLLAGLVLPGVVSGQSAKSNRVRVALVPALPDTLARAVILRFRDAAKPDIILLPARTATPKDLAMASVLLRNMKRQTPVAPGDARIILTGGAPPARGGEATTRRYEALLRLIRATPRRPVAGYGQVSWAEVDIS